jgi:hypothetical protein
MAKRYFADSYHFIALLSVWDDAHERAVELSRELTGEIVTTDAVLLELADGFSAPGLREGAAIYIRDLWRSAQTQVLPTDRPLLERALTLYASRADKDWSLTDCISFVVMQDEGIVEALTGDSHFKQAGFRIL